MSRVHVALLPSALHSMDLRGSIAVVIDVLRATTTMVHALAAGAESIVACSEVAEAFAHRDQLGGDRCVLGGERHGLLIEGFQLDNSPFRYTTEAVAGKVVVFTTTNGTRALAAVQEVDRVLIGAFVNRQAIVDELRRDGRPVWLVCAGTDGFVTAEDVLFAGSIAAELRPSDEEPLRKGLVDVKEIESLPADSANAVDVAVQFYEAYGRTAELRLAAMRESRGGRNLLENGFDRDIARAADDSLFDIVPEWRDGLITARSSSQRSTDP